MNRVIAISALTALCVMPLLNAQASEKAQTPMAKMKCQDVLLLGDDVQPVVVGWIDGFNSKGKLVSEDIVEDDVVVPDAAAVMESCKQTPQARVSQVIKSTKTK